MSGFYSNFDGGEPNGGFTASPAVVETRGQFFGSQGLWNDLNNTTTYSSSNNNNNINININNNNKNSSSSGGIAERGGKVRPHSAGAVPYSAHSLKHSTIR